MNSNTHTNAEIEPKTYEVTVEGFSPIKYIGRHPAKVRAKAFRSYQNYDNYCTFKKFLQISKIRRVDNEGFEIIKTENGFYWKLGPIERDNCCSVMRDGCDWPMRLHELDIIHE